MAGHGRDITGDQHPSGIRGDSQNFSIGGGVGNDALGAAEIKGWLPSAQAPCDFGVEIGIGLESNLQSG
jgi:hypothetical protein